MSRFKYLRKVVKAYREGGTRLLLRRVTRYLSESVFSSRSEYQGLGLSGDLRDVLFINGCYLQHPSRYRVDHQIEQLEFMGFTCDKIFFNEIQLDMVAYYRVFVFFRCDYSEGLDAFVVRAKALNKPTVFDIDDLMFAREETLKIQYVQQMNETDRGRYLEHVSRIGRMMSICDYGIGSTPVLVEQMQKYIKRVHLNRNVASAEMVYLSRLAREARSRGEIESVRRHRIRIGYSSGSKTHNPDLAMVESALLKICAEFPNVDIVLFGEIDASSRLQQLGSQLVREKAVDWRELPAKLASLDINIAPIESSLFNAAKSENKWLEAALVGVPTIASNVGAFAESITHAEDGFLCDTEITWLTIARDLIENADLRMKIGTTALRRVLQLHVTQHTGRRISEFIREIAPKSAVFMVPNLQKSGGLRVIAHHAQVLQEHGMDVSLFVDAPCASALQTFGSQELVTISKADSKLDRRTDLYVATLWTTLAEVMSNGKALRKAYFVQNYESDFYTGKDRSKKIAANASYTFGSVIDYKTISKWCVNWLADDFEIKADYIPNGINLALFTPRTRVINVKESVIHILVEGNADDTYKNVDESMEIVRRIKQKYGDFVACHYMYYAGSPKEHYPVDFWHASIDGNKVGAIYRYCDVLIKSSLVESFSYPPLEMMATGGLVVVARNGGNAEYIEHEGNCLAYDAGDMDSAVSCFSRLVQSPPLREKLAAGGLVTAESRSWRLIDPDIMGFWSA